MAKKDTQPQDDMAAELLLKDADDALHQEKLHAIWTEWGSTIIGIALMIIFGTMIGVGWKNWRSDVEASQTTQLLAIQDAGSASIMKGDNNLSPHYDAITKMMAGADIAIASKGEVEKSTAILMHNMMIDADKGDLPRYYDILAEWAKLRTLYDADETSDRMKIADDMMDLANRRNNAFEAMIKTEAAMIYGANNNYESAIEVLNNNITDFSDTMPSALLTQNQNLILLYSSYAHNNEVIDNE